MTGEKPGNVWGIRWPDGSVNGPYLGVPSDSTFDDQTFDGYVVVFMNEQGEWVEW